MLQPIAARVQLLALGIAVNEGIQDGVVGGRHAMLPVVKFVYLYNCFSEELMGSAHRYLFADVYDAPRVSRVELYSDELPSS